MASKSDKSSGYYTLEGEEAELADQMYPILIKYGDKSFTDFDAYVSHPRVFQIISNICSSVSYSLHFRIKAIDDIVTGKKTLGDYTSLEIDKKGLYYIWNRMPEHGQGGRRRYKKTRKVKSRKNKAKKSRRH